MRSAAGRTGSSRSSSSKRGAGGNPPRRAPSANEGTPMKIAAAGVCVLAVAFLSAAHDRPTSAAAPRRITFTKDVAPILQQKCQVCHQPDSIGPMPLLTYEDAREYAEKIRRKVSQRLMPPWHIDRTI